MKAKFLNKETSRRGRNFQPAQFMTELDKAGTRHAVEERFRKENCIAVPEHSPVASLESLDELSKRDQQREKDGFPKKIKTRRIMVGPGRIINVPYVEEEKLVHGEFEPSDASDRGEPGHGEGDIGDVIGEIPLWGEGEGEGDGDGESDEPHAGQGEGGDHGEEEEAYRFGKELAAQFQLPNLKDKGKKVPTDEYVYDLTDRHRGSGQLLDKKATLKSIVRTNVALGRINKDDIDTSKMVVGPQDKIYRVLSKERVWKSQAIVFFLRDYSGSMWGEPTKAVIAQHLMIYAWLMDQYDKLVIPRFVVHDYTAREVSVIAYFRLQASGGTLIASGYKKILEIIEGEGLARDYNIYVFQGTDGDDWGDDGREATQEIEKILGYANRMGVSLLKHPYYNNRDTNFESYIKKANFLGRRDLFRMHVMLSTEVTDDKNIEAVKTLIAQD